MAGRKAYTLPCLNVEGREWGGGGGVELYEEGGGFSSNF